MPPTDHLVAFFLMAAVVIGVPGPSVLFAITRSITLGRSAGVATVVGNAAGVYVQVILVALGLGAIVAESAAIFTAIKFAGALYLAYLGVMTFLHRRALLGAVVDGAVEPKTLRRILRDGFIVGLLNPKSIVFFVAVLPQFVDRTGPVTQQLLVLGVMFCSLAVVLDGTWAMLAGTAREWFAKSPRRLEAIGGVGGVTMIGLGTVLALTGRKD
ncbi:MAG: LysE family translocator [Solirubrobacteraceae bacterium]|nr:LysE family translocator [Solirubrobacteraceae bacterium]